MIWMGIFYKGMTPPVEMKVKINAKKYVEMLDAHLNICVADLIDGEWMFMQDNAPCHTAILTKEWFQKKNIPVMKWTACYPDLNPIKHVWGC